MQVKWSEIPHEKRRGCLRKYTVYLMDKLKEDIKNYSKVTLQLTYQSRYLLFTLRCLFLHFFYKAARLGCSAILVRFNKSFLMPNFDCRCGLSKETEYY